MNIFFKNLFYFIRYYFRYKKAETVVGATFISENGF